MTKSHYDLAGARQLVVQDCLQAAQIAAADDLFEPAFCSCEGRVQPASDDLAILPVAYAQGLDARFGVRTFDDVEGFQAANQGRRNARPLNGVAFKAYQQTDRARRSGHALRFSAPL